MKDKKDIPDITCSTCYVGIDVGWEGAVCVMNDYFVETYSYPIIETTDSNGKIKKRLNIEEMFNIFTQIIPLNSVILIEDIHSMPRQGVVSAFSFGRQLGVLEAMMTTFTGAEPFYVTPQKWKEVYPQLITDEMRDIKEKSKLVKGKEKNKLNYRYKKLAKEQSIILANEIFNSHYVNSMKVSMEQTFFEKDGEAEAFLIACYAMKYF